MHLRFEQVGEALGGGTALVVDHPDGGCTIIAEQGELHAVFQVSRESRLALRADRQVRANRAAGARRRSA